LAALLRLQVHAVHGRSVDGPQEYEPIVVGLQHHAAVRGLDDVPDPMANRYGLGEYHAAVFDSNAKQGLRPQ
jgi:hypothetical protein